MSHTKTIVIGYSPAAVKSLQELLPPRSVLLIEEPDVIRKRGIAEIVQGYAVIDRLVPFEYQRDGAADQFYEMERDLPVVSVVPITEYATPFAARLAEHFNVPGAGYEASLTLRNKNRLRAVTSAHGINNPGSQLVSSFEDVQAFAAQVAGSLVIKPANRQGSVGTVIVHDRRELNEAWEASRKRDEGVMVPDREFPEVTLVEQFVAGAEFSVEALVQNGQVLFSNVTKKDLFAGVNPVEQAHTVPAPLHANATALLVRETRRLIEATGFGTGIIHCEWIFDGTDAYLVECAGRFAGDGIIDLIARAYTFDIVGSYHQLMRGEQLSDLPTQAGKTAMVRFLGGRDAEISAVAIDEEALSRPGVAHYYVTARAGDRAFTPTMSWHRLGAVTVEAPDAVAAAQLAERALASIRISYTESGGQ